MSEGIGAVRRYGGGNPSKKSERQVFFLPPPVPPEHIPEPRGYSGHHQEAEHRGVGLLFHHDPVLVLLGIREAGRISITGTYYLEYQGNPGRPRGTNLSSRTRVRTLAGKEPGQLGPCGGLNFP